MFPVFEGMHIKSLVVRLVEIFEALTCGLAPNLLKKHKA